MSYVGADLLKNKSPNYAGLAKNAEKARQANIKQGTSLIDAVFGGGPATFYYQSPGDFDKNQDYFRINNKGEFTPWDITGTKKGVDPLALIASGIPGGAGVLGHKKMFDNWFGSDGEKSPADRYKGSKKKGNVYVKETGNFQGFTPDFYSDREKAYMDFALPQINEQYRDTKDQIGFGLYNRGLQDSGAAVKQFSRLNRMNKDAKDSAVDTSIAQSQNLRKEVEGVKNNLLAQLYQSADPAQGLRSAIDSAANFRQPSVFPALTNTFSGLLNQYYTSQLLNRSSVPSFGMPQSFGSNSSGALPPVSSSFR